MNDSASLIVVAVPFPYSQVALHTILLSLVSNSVKIVVNRLDRTYLHQEILALHNEDVKGEKGASI